MDFSSCVRWRRPTGSDYGAGRFTRADFAGLAVALAGIRGRFILSVNDLPETRAIFGRFVVDQVDACATASPAAAAPTCARSW
jgi:DNA adenine methylase